MYKKSLAVLLSCLLLVTSFITLFSFSAAADSTNLVADGTFENGFNGWEVFNYTGKTDAAFSVVKDGENNVLSAVPGLSMFKQVTLEAGVSYTVGFDFKFDTNAAVPATYDSFYRVGFANSVAALGNSNFVGPYATGNKYYSVYGNQNTDPTNWKSHTFTYTPTTDMTTYFVVGSYNGDGKANFFVDNVYLCKTSEVVTVTTVAGEGGSVSGSVKTYKGGSATVSAVAKTGYIFEGWYNAEGNKLSDSAVYTFTAETGIELTAKFKEGQYDPNMITNGDFAANNLDDFEVFKNGNNASLDFTFSPSGDDYVLVGKAGHSLYKQVELKANTEYIMSFDFRFVTNDVPATYDSFYRAGFVSSVGALGGSAFVVPNASGSNYYSIYPYQKADPTNWKTHTIKFTPSEDMTVYAVIGSFNHDCVADFEIDNWSLYKSSDFVTVTTAANGGGKVSESVSTFVGTTVTVTATADADYEFVGWFNGDTAVSAEANYEFVVTESVTLTAKFRSTIPVDNYIVNGDFEQPFTTDTISNTSLTAVTGKWGKIYSGVARMEAIETAAFTEADSAEKNGTRYITSGATKDANQFIRAFGQYVELTAGAYVLEFDAKATVGDLFVVSFKEGQNSIDSSTDTIKYLSESTEWKHYELELTVENDGLYQIAFGGNTNGKGEGDFSIDNVKLALKAVENYIVNGDFEEPFTTDKISDVSLTATTGKWGKIYSGVARMEAIETAAFTEADSAEKNGTRYITSGATKDANQYIRAFGQYVDLPAGDYVLEFDAKATVGGMFVVSVKEGQESINFSSDTIKYLNESAEWAHYTVKFTATNAGIYQIAFGGNNSGLGEGDFSIDNVVLVNGEGYTTVTATTDGGGKVSYPTGNVNIGDPATVTATPDEGYIFKGWYIGTELVSADEAYTFTVTESIELKAMFELDLGGDTAIIKNGKFDLGSTAGWTVVKTAGGSSVAVVTDETTGSLVAKTSGKGGIAFIQKVNLKAGTEYLIGFDIKFADYDAIPATYDSFYRSGFLNDPKGGLGNANFAGPYSGNNIYYSIYSKISTDKLNDWNSLSYTFTPATDMETWFVIGAYNNQGESDFAIDNVSIVEKANASSLQAVAVSHGGSGTVTSSKSGLVSPGETVTLTATANEGSAFGGWYLNSQLISENESYQHTVMGAEVVYARFIDPEYPDGLQMMDNSDFATGDLSGWKVNNTASANTTVEYVTVDGESYAKVGANDVLYQIVELEPYSTYMVRVTSRIPDIRKNSYGVHDTTFFRFGLSKLETPNVMQSGSLAQNPYSYSTDISKECDCETNNRFHCAMEWGTYTYTYSNNSPDTVLANVVIGAPYCTSDIHIKSLEFLKYGDGITDFAPTDIYGEDFFNAVKNSTFENKLTDDDWGAKLPNGWSVKEESGNRYLSVSGNQSKIYEIDLSVSATYLIAFDLRTTKSGTSNISIVDANGNVLGDAFKVSDQKAIFAPQANGKWQHMGVHAYVAANEEGITKAYIKISGGTNTLDIDNITVVKVGYATHETNPNNYAIKAYDYNNPVYYNPTMFYALSDTDGTTGSLDANEGYEGVNTGDSSARTLTVIAFILIPCALVMLFTAKRTRKNKKEVE